MEKPAELSFCGLCLPWQLSTLAGPVVRQDARGLGGRLAKPRSGLPLLSRGEEPWGGSEATGEDGRRTLHRQGYIFMRVLTEEPRKPFGLRGS